MKKRFRVLVILALFLLPSSAPAQSVSGKIVIEFDLSAHGAGKDVRLWIPYPVANQYQNISEVKIDGEVKKLADKITEGI